MITEIQYKDKINWESISGKSTNWNNYSKKFKKERVQPNYVTPDIVVDAWDGTEHDVQHTTWESYYFQINIKESEIDAIRQLKSCSDINIIEYNGDSGVISKSYENIDLIKADYLNISEPQRADTTTGWVVEIIFRTERTIINKALPVDNTNNITFQDNVWKNDFLDEISSIDAATKLATNEFATTTGSDLYKYQLVNNTWQTVGNQALLSGIYSDLTALDSSTVARINDAGSLETYSFDGTNWSKVGNTLALGVLTRPVISALSSTRIAFYDDSIGEIRAYDWSGTDWTLTGSGLSITAGNADICALSSSKTAFINFSDGQIRDYDFNGSIWTVNDTLNTTLSGTISITKIGTNRIAATSTLTDNIESYILDGTWSQESLSSSLTSSTGLIESTDTDKVYLSAGSESGIYSYGIYEYYSDFDVLDWVKSTENIDVEWYDGTVKLIQTNSKLGFEYLQYILTEDHDNFIDKLKASTITKVNGTEITEVVFESSLIAQGVYKIVVRGVSSTTINTFDISPNNDHNITIDGTPYYTDWLPEYISESPDISQVENQTGEKTSTKSITKQVKQVKFYLNETDAFNLKWDFENLSTTKQLDSVDILEEREVAPEKIGVDLYEVVVNCLLGTTSN